MSVFPLSWPHVSFSRYTDAELSAATISCTALNELISRHAAATLMKRLSTFARAASFSSRKISVATQLDTWLKRFVSSTMFGARSSLFFLFHAWPRHSFGEICWKRCDSISESCRATSVGS